MQRHQIQTIRLGFFEPYLRRLRSAPTSTSFAFSPLATLKRVVFYQFRLEARLSLVVGHFYECRFCKHDSGLAWLRRILQNRASFRNATASSTEYELLVESTFLLDILEFLLFAIEIFPPRLWF